MLICMPTRPVRYLAAKTIAPTRNGSFLRLSSLTTAEEAVERKVVLEDVA